MRKTKRILSIFLILVMLAGLLPQAAFAADKVAYVKIGGVTTDYSGCAAAWNAAVKSNNATVGLYKSYMHHQGENATRAQIAAMFMRFCGVMENE